MCEEGSNRYEELEVRGGRGKRVGKRGKGKREEREIEWKKVSRWVEDRGGRLGRGVHKERLTV